jgi:hypothetical protein
LIAIMFSEAARSVSMLIVSLGAAVLPSVFAIAAAASFGFGSGAMRRPNQKPLMRKLMPTRAQMMMFFIESSRRP